MSRIPLGRVSPIPRGEFDINTQYEILDIVTYNNNSSYIAKKSTINNELSNTEYWQLLASGISDTQEIIDWTIISPNEVYVNSLSDNEIENGTINFPFKSLQLGIDNALFGSNIIIAPSNYDENIIIEDKQNLTLVAEGAIGQFRVVINGNLTIRGTSNRIGITNIQFNGSYINNSLNCLTYFDNVNIVNETNLNGGGYHRYDYCFFRDLNIKNDTFCDIRSSQCEDLSTWSCLSSTATLSMIDILNVFLNHKQGNIFVSGTTMFIPVSSDNIGLISTANVGEGLLRIDNGTFKLSDGNYCKIEKTGNCLYTLGIVVYEPNISILNGDRIDSGLHSDQIFDNYNRINYTPIDGSLKSHLDAIDNKLGDVDINVIDLISTDDDNAIMQGTDNKLFVDKSSIGTGEERDFITNPIDLSTETTGILNIESIPQGIIEDIDEISNSLDGIINNLNITSDKLNSHIDSDDIHVTLIEKEYIQFLNGLIGNVQSQIDLLENKLDLAQNPFGNTYIVDTHADLSGISNPTERDLAFVRVDETQNNSTTLYNFTISWEFVMIVETEVRDFLVNPIDLSTEVTGILSKNNLPSDVGVNNHQELTNLDYNNSGHIGFASSNELNLLQDEVTLNKTTILSHINDINTELDNKLEPYDIVSGDNIHINRTGNIVMISAFTVPTPSIYPRYGVRIADVESNPLMERMYDAVDMVANVGTSLTDTPTNDFDDVYPFNQIVEETINGRVMIRIPKFYVRREHYQKDGLWRREWSICQIKYDNSYVPHEMFLKGNVAFIGSNPESDYNDYVWVAKYETSSNNQSISGASVQVSQTRATMRTNAKSIGDGWTVMDIATWSGLWTLFHIVFANRDSQSIMKGNYSGAVKSTGITTGSIASCVQISNTAMSFYGIENLYCNVYKWIDGININERQSYISTRIPDFADNTSTNYRQVGYVNDTTDGYITRLGYDNNNKFAEFPIAVGGSSSTYYSDYYYQATGWRVLCVGGYWDDYAYFGVSCWYASSASSNAVTSIGSRLTYKSF